MEPRLELLTFGFALQGVICAAVAVTVLVFARGRMLKLVRVLSGAWAALAVYYLVFAVGVPVPLEADVERFVGGLVTSVLYFTFLILLGAGSRLLSSGRPIPARVITTLLAGATGYALVTMVAFLLAPDGTPLRYFLRVGLRSFLGAGAVFWGAWMLWRHREPRSKLGPRLLGTGLAIWGVTQAYYAVTSLFGSLGVRLDEPAFRMFLPLVGSAGLVLGGMAVLGWMLETERHQTEIQVTRGRLLFERAAAPMAFVSPDMRFLEANEAFATLLGYRPGELAGRSVLDFTHPEDVEASRGAGQTRPEDGRSEPFVKRYIRATGEVVWVRLVSTRIRDEEGRPDYYLAVYEDQTEV